jgi:hypothetical protein
MVIVSRRGVMKTLGILAILGITGLGLVWFSPSCRVIRSFDNFERNARKVITGPELAAWGARMLAQFPTNATPRLAELGTNFPPQLLKLGPKLGPHIVVYEADGTNAPGWVMCIGAAASSDIVDSRWVRRTSRSPGRTICGKPASTLGTIMATDDD